MRKLARVLRTELIPARYRWVAEGLAALFFAAIAWAALVWLHPDAWHWGVLWAVIALQFALQSAFRLSGRLAHWRAARRARGGGCVRCGYDLRHLSSRHCPECGAPRIAPRADAPDPSR